MGKSATAKVEPTVISISKLAADPTNPRTISDEALAGLGASVEDFGDLSGITFNRRTGELVTGHQRVEALKAAGADEIDVDEDGRWTIVHPVSMECFPVRVVDWDSDRQRIANLVANNPAIGGEFTPAALEQLKALEDEAAFTSLRLDALEDQLTEQLEELEAGEPAGGNTDPDDVPEPPAVPITQPGDLWILGDHKLLCGDATKLADVDRLMGGEKAVLFATDPPYGVDYGGVKRNIPTSDGEGDRFKDWGDIENDTLGGDDLGDFLTRMFSAAAVQLAENAAWYVWHPSGPLAEVFRTAMVGSGALVHRQIIWKKPGFVLTRSGMYHWAHEPCLYGWRQGYVPPWYGEKNQTSVWEVGRDEGKAVHPTQKPVALFEIPMANHTRRGEVCYEPFSGSGSQIIAGERLGRRVFAMELSPRWVDAAVARWETFTGRKAERQPASVHGDDDVNF